MKTWYVYANPAARLIGVGASDPPATGGVVLDTFEHDGGTDADRLRIAESRNGPLRVERFEQGSWQPYPETYAATSSGYDEAIVFLGQMARNGTQGQMRIITRSGVIIPHDGIRGA